MTVIRKHLCNLCGDPIKPTEGAALEGFGLHFSQPVGGGLVFRRVSETEHHICHACAKSIHDELRKVTPA